MPKVKSKVDGEARMKPKPRARKSVKRVIGTYVKEPQCPWCEMSTKYQLCSHVYTQCSRCLKTLCSNTNHKKKHEAEDLEAWLKEKNLTRDSDYSLPVLGTNTPIDGTPVSLLKDVMLPRETVCVFSSDGNLQYSKLADISMPLWKYPTDVFYLGVFL